MNRVAQDFSRASASYDAHAEIQAAMGRALLAYLPGEGGRLLELGCGTGRLLSELPTTWHASGLDLAEAMCRRAAMQAPHADILRGDMQALPFAEHSFDVVLSAAALQWAEDPKKVFAETARVLAPGGMAAFATFGPQTLNELRETYHSLGLTPPLLNFPTLQELSDDARTAGLRLRHRDTAIRLEYEADLTALTQRLKALGATDKRPGRGLTTPRQWMAVRAAYPAQADARIAVTWECLTLVMEKA